MAERSGKRGPTLEATLAFEEIQAQIAPGADVPDMEMASHQFINVFRSLQARLSQDYTHTHTDTGRSFPYSP